MPHPILKRAHSAQQAPPTPPRSAPAHSSHPSVHFPPSPSLTRTFSAHSPAYYDRSPIEVAPNTCALPARGCPGRTYYDGSPRGQSAPEQRRHRLSKALHPRALAAYEAQMYEDEGDEDDSAELERTPTRTSPYIPLPVPPPIPQSYPYSHAPSPYSLPASTPHYPIYQPQSAAYQSIPPPPPLVPDLSSSSDESDGFTSPQLGPAVGYLVVPGKYPYPYSAYPAASYPAPHSYPAPQMPPSAVPSERKRRSRKSSPRRPVAEDGDAGYEEEDLPGSFSHAGAFVARVVPSPECTPPKPSKDGRSRKEPRQKKDRCVAALCRSLAGTGFRDENEGCLGGF
ncbi:hypothetical protein GGX14DRAFT_664187 [Mycena pura]|uniref:Uncharacterized protein n=1 Tax=Mycena pura TaxID=153505 RepID=A0AAD6YL93_9AGAR|nr:hypothetical protein GGX14DRAFT_664187 [Mycena pura]